MEDIAQQWVNDMRNDLRVVASSINSLTWEEICARYEQQTGINGSDDTVWGVMSSYMVGREFNDEGMVHDAKTILLPKIPDLEERLPLYEAMFRIMDKGRLYDGTDEGGLGSWHFDLDEAVRRELTASLAERMDLQTNTASFAVRFLSREMGYIPGAQYDTMRRTCGPPAHRPLEIALISSYLHRPMSRVVTIRNEETVADIHIQQLREDLARFNQRSGD